MSEPSGSSVDEPAGHLNPATLFSFAGLPSDATGTTTFERFLWQAKLSVRNWLATLSPSGPTAVVCEHVEDLVIVEQDLFRFAQLKTRDKGSWTATKICAPGHAVSTLVRSYFAALEAGILAVSRFEVWLEGPQSEDPDTVRFFMDPSSASTRIKQKIREMGLAGTKLKDFLERLKIHCKQPSRESIDAVVMKAIGAVWPHLSYTQIELLYEKLLTAATAAQSSSGQPQAVRIALAAARLSSDDEHWEPIRTQTLTREQIRALCPPLGSETNERLLERAAAGEATLLELKLVRAGAGQETIAAAKLARADADIVASSVIAAGSVDRSTFTALDQRLVSMANSVLALGAMGGNHVSGPAEFVYHSLMSHPTDVNSTDPVQVFGGDHRLVVGHLCNISDQCRFGWGLS